MESYLKLVEEGDTGGETALRDLGLEGIQEVTFIPHESRPTLEALEAEYLRAKKVALGAQLLEVGLLEKLAIELMTFLEFLASYLYKSKLKVQIDTNAVGRALQIRIHHIKQWFKSIGEVSDEGQRQHFSEWLCDFIGEAVKGDPEALSFFSLDEPLRIQSGVLNDVPNVTSLKMHFRRAKECAAVGDYLGDKQLLAIAKSFMAYTQYLAEMKHGKKLDVPIDGQDVAGGLLTHIRSLKCLGERVARRWRGQQSGDENSSSNDDSDNGDENNKEKNTDPDYEPEDIKKTETKGQRSKANVGKTQKEKTMSSKQVDEERQNTKAKETAQGEEAQEKKLKKKSHHSIKDCPFQTCSYKGPNLPRHLRRYHGMAEQEVVKLNSIARLQGKRRGPRRRSKGGLRLGLRIKWCPIEKCNKATHILRKHLQRDHKLKSGEVLENYLRIAKEYKGKLEQEEVQHMHLSRKRKRSQSDDSASEQSHAQKVLKGEEEAHSDDDKECSSEQEYSGDDEEEDCSESEPQVDYFTSKTPRTDRHKWLVGFYSYLHYPDCGRKKNRNRLQHASHIKTILEDLDPKGTGIDILAEEEGYIVWTQWVDVNMGPKTSGTINAYLGTFEKFLTFVTLDRIRPGALPTLSEDVTKILRNTKERLKGWRRTVDLEMRPKRNQRVLDECDSRLTIEDVEKFKASRPVMSARKAFQKAADGLPLTILEICEVRDLLIWLFTIKTGTRPGALENTQLQHYRTMRRDPGTGDSVMLIPEHKRAVDGPAMLALDDELVDLLSIYVENVHPQFPSPRDDYLFLQNTGKRFMNGTINRRLPEMWLRSGVRPDLRVTATNIRKFIVTVLQENKAAGAEFDERGVRIAMCHTQKTAMNSYLREDLTAVASRAARTIKQFTDKSSNYQPLKNRVLNKADAAVDKQPSNSDEKALSTSGVNNAADEASKALPPTSSSRRPPTDDAAVDKQPRSFDEKSPSTSSENNAANEASSVPSPISSSKRSTTDNAAVDKQPSSFDGNTPSTFSENNAKNEARTVPLPPTSSTRRPLTDDEKKRIQEVFQGTIMSNTIITMQGVRQTMRKDDKLVKIEEIDGMVKKVVDYLRNIQKNVPRQEPKELPTIPKSKQVEQWLTRGQGDDSSIETSLSKKQVWSDEDVDEIVKVFTRKFGSLKKVPPRGKIKETFENELAEILERRKDFLSCYNKVKHLVQLTNKKKL